MSGQEKLILPQELKIEKGEGSLGNVEKQDLEKNYLALREYAKDLQNLIDNLDKSQANKVINVPAQGKMRLRDFLQQTLERAIWLDKDGSFDKWNYEFVPDIQDAEKVEAMREMLDEIKSISPFASEDFSNETLPGQTDLDLNDRLLDLESKTVTEHVTPADYILLRSRLKRLSDYFEQEVGKDIYDSETDTLTVKDAAAATVETAYSKAENEVALSVAAEDSVNDLSEALSNVRYAFVKNLKEVIKSGELKEFMIKTGGEVMYGSDQSVLEFVKEMQKYLAAKGYADKLKYSKNDGIDGLIGPRTLQSLRGYLAEDKVAANAEPTANEGVSDANGGAGSKSGSADKAKDGDDKPKTKVGERKKGDDASEQKKETGSGINERLVTSEEFAEFVTKLDFLSRPKHGGVGGVNTIRSKKTNNNDGEAEFEIETTNSSDSGIVILEHIPEENVVEYTIVLDQLGPDNRTRTGRLKFDSKSIDAPHIFGNQILELYERLRTNLGPEFMRDDDYEEAVEDTDTYTKEGKKSLEAKHEINGELPAERQIDPKDFKEFVGKMNDEEAYGLILKSGVNEFPVKFDLATNEWLKWIGTLQGVGPGALLLGPVGAGIGGFLGHETGSGIYNDTLTLNYDNTTGKIYGRLNSDSPFDAGNVHSFSMDIGLFNSRYKNDHAKFVDYVKGQYKKMIGDKLNEKETKETNSGIKAFNDILSRLNDDNIAAGTTKISTEYAEQTFEYKFNNQEFDGVIKYDENSHSVLGIVNNKVLFRMSIQDFASDDKRQDSLKTAIVSFAKNLEKEKKDIEQEKTVLERIVDRLKDLQDNQQGVYGLEWEITHLNHDKKQVTRVLRVKEQAVDFGTVKVVFDIKKPNSFTFELKQGGKGKNITIDNSGLEKFDFVRALQNIGD